MTLIPPSPTRTRSEYREFEKREGFALALSGGGFRAVFFHLGALRFLYQNGLLHKLNAISSVSGGSILAAFVGAKWSELQTGDPQPEIWERVIAAPLRRFALRDHRTLPFLRGLFPGKQAVEYLADRYDELFSGARLEELPDNPRIMICGANLTSGAFWWCEKHQIGDMQIGFQHPPKAIDRLSLAVAISSCFPPIFQPLRLPLDEKEFVPAAIRDSAVRARLARTTLLNDGGTYDNLGIENLWPVFRTVLVSDAGAPLGMYEHSWLDRVLWHALRSTELNDQLGRLARRRAFIGQIESGTQKGAYWGIASAPVEIDGSFKWGYSPNLVRARISRMRTDLACFSELEQHTLENHGFAMAYASCHAWAFEPLELTPSPDAPSLPHADAVDESRVESALRYSDYLLLTRRKLARMLNLRKSDAV